ncbi:SHOCT domain-containing protein [Parahaliea mediterranea]|uniref:SHOCT domain-containing protein n=1 Tax=Parahaliea mediterranea TaxID=651086 RepID=A0A939DIN3_9GAMM|nr:SHOCT domain-containing protein [Parahaliea mediterranea]MBN7798232.1 SHOCT domain-containing protein [Parahaliea mediterranea]
MSLNKALAFVVVVASLALSGCGSSTETRVEQVDTQGQQLIDLKAAYDQGIITEKEYERAKKDILKGS